MCNRLNVARLNEKTKKTDATDDTTVDLNESDDLNARQYFEIRSRAIHNLQTRSDDPVNPYPHKFHVTISIPEFNSKYEHLQKAQTVPEDSVTVAGRVHTLRNTGKNLRFYVIHADGEEVQIHASSQ